MATKTNGWALLGRKLPWALALIAIGGCALWETGAKAPGVAYVDMLDLSGATCGQGKRLQLQKSVDGHALTVAGKTYARGFGTRPESVILFRTNGKVTAFDALVAIDDDAKGAGSGNSYGQPTARFKVWADCKVVWDSGSVKLGQKPVAAHADLTGVRPIKFSARRRDASAIRTRRASGRDRSSRVSPQWRSSTAIHSRARSRCRSRSWGWRANAGSRTFGGRSAKGSILASTWRRCRLTLQSL